MLAILKSLKSKGYKNIIFRNHSELDLTNQQSTVAFFQEEKPEYVILAAAKVGGIMANNTYRADFIYENMMIQSNVIHHSYLNGVKKLMFLGSSCIYPKMAPQPLKEEYLLSLIEVIVDHEEIKEDVDADTEKVSRLLERKAYH
mgnify:CR=1 FL=1